MRVEWVEHRFERGVSYLNTARGVARERWGASSWLPPRGMLGSLQAEVTHNDDPNHLGRIRVRLSDDPERRRPDISVARTRLGWQPSTQLEEGLGKTIDYFERRLAQLEKAA